MWLAQTQNPGCVFKNRNWVWTKCLRCEKHIGCLSCGPNISSNALKSEIHYSECQQHNMIPVAMEWNQSADDTGRTHHCWLDQAAGIHQSLHPLRTNVSLPQAVTQATNTSLPADQLHAPDCSDVKQWQHYRIANTSRLALHQVNYWCIRHLYSGQWGKIINSSKVKEDWSN